MNAPNLYCALKLGIDFATAQNRFGIQWVEVWGVKKMKKQESSPIFGWQESCKSRPRGALSSPMLDPVIIPVVLQQKFDWPTTSLYRQEFGWRKHQDIGLQSGKLAINVQVISHLHFNVYRVPWCLRHANNCIDACGLLLFARPDRFLFCRVQC